jgi:hypothetical protein
LRGVVVLDYRGGRRVGGKQEEARSWVVWMLRERRRGWEESKPSAFDLIGAVEELDRGWRLLIKRIVGLIVGMGEREEKNEE